MGKEKIYEEKDSLDVIPEEDTSNIELFEAIMSAFPSNIEAFGKALNKLHEKDSKSLIRGDIRNPKYPKVIVELEGDTKDNRIIVAFMENKCFNCQTGEEINPDSIKTKLGNLEDLLDSDDDYQYVHILDCPEDSDPLEDCILYSAIMVINEEKLKNIKKNS